MIDTILDFMLAAIIMGLAALGGLFLFLCGYAIHMWTHRNGPRTEATR